MVPGRLNCTFNLRFRGPVRAHRVQRYDAWHGGFRLAGFFDVQNFAALVVSALGAGAVRHLALVTIGALGERVALESVVCAADAGASFRVSPFWIRHSIPLFSSILIYRYLVLPVAQWSSLPRISFKADHRGSSSGSAHAHFSTFRFVPQCGQSPLQSSRQIAFKGSDRMTCSCNTSSSCKPSP